MNLITTYWEFVKMIFRIIPLLWMDLKSFSEKYYHLLRCLSKLDKSLMKEIKKGLDCAYADCAIFHLVPVKHIVLDTMIVYKIKK